MKKYICLALFMLPLSIFAQTMLQGKISLKDATDTFTETGVSIYWEDTTIGTTTDAYCISQSLKNWWSAT